MSKPKILIQFDPDTHASTFDSVVAIDAGVDQLLCQPGVTTEEIESLVHGAMFTRGPADLKNTALFFGGSDVARTELLVDAAKKCFFGPMRVSLLSDPNGCNTTAAAAVLSVEQHFVLAGQTITVLAGTGPVGQRIAQLVAGPATSGAAPPTVRVCSRRLEKAEAVCEQLESKTSGTLVPLQTSTPRESLDAISGSQVVFAAGAAGIELLPAGWAELAPAVAVDLNAVPPAGISGIDVMDSGQERDGVLCFGAIGVGGLKMKIHKRAIQMLFESNDQVLQVEEIYQLGKLVAN
jgi:hypothetical protein